MSPWTWEALDNEGDRITITVAFNNLTRLILGGTVYRDATCTYTRILIGMSEGGVPDDTPMSVDIPAGTTAVLLTWFTVRGLLTIEDVLALQITAAP